MIPRKKRKLMIILSVVLTILLIIAICVILYFTTDSFKSSKTLFSKYIVQNFNQIANLSDTSYFDKANTLLQNNIYESNLEANVEYREGGNSDNPINKINLKINNEVDREDGYNYKDITLSNENEKLFRVEYVENNDIHASRQDGIKQFVTNNSDDKIFKIIENLNNIDLNELLLFTNEELQSLQNTYLGIITQSISENNFSKKTATISIGDSKLNTNAYSITLTKENFNNLYIEILEQLKQDDIILSKLEKIENEVNKYVNKQTNLKEDFIKEIESTIEEIKNTNIGQEQRTITVYESRGQLVRTEIKTEEIEISLDIQNSENYFMNEIKISENTEKENSIDFKFEKKFDIDEENISIYIEKIEESVSSNLELSTSKKFEEDTSSMNNSIKLKIYNEDNEGILSINNNTKLVNKFDNKIELDVDNCVDLEELDEEKINEVKGKLEQNLNNQIEKINSVITTEDVNNILINLGIIEKPVDKIENTGETTEAERNRFNVKYEFYAGENINLESVNGLIDTSKGELKTIKITSYKEKLNSKGEKVPNGYKLIIEKDNENTELANKLKEQLEKENNKSFSVKIEYNEETQLVENILLNVNE